MNASQPQPHDGRTVDPDEITRFSALSDQWWSATGPMAPLHAMNPIRLAFIRDQACQTLGLDMTRLKPLAGLSVLDVGCGAGLLSEPLARMGASVTGLDASADLIAAARAHATAQGLAIDYQAGAAEDLAATPARFDLITALEVIEHVSDMPAFLAALHGLLKPSGLLALSTLNRTPQSFATAIVGAEYLLRLLPRGTHQWRKFVTPKEPTAALTEAGLDVLAVRGMSYAPLQRAWRLSDETLINYILMAQRPA